MTKGLSGRLAALGVLLGAMLVLAGCSFLFGSRGETEQAPEAEATERVIVPTFTPTPEGAAPTATPAPPTAAVAVEVPTAAPSQPVTSSAPITAAADLTAATGATQTGALSETGAPTVTLAEATPIPKLVVSGDVVNARSGPGTEFGLVGSVTQNQAFDIIGRNADGTWWQFCCVNGQQAWIFGELVSTENAESVPVAQNIPAAPEPVAAAPTSAPAPAAPAEPAAPPTDTPAPAPADQQAVNAGACGGDDGCKFHISSGPTMQANGGFELKFQLMFKHSGVEGGQPQGDYRLGIEKDGQLITFFADATSIALTRNSGPMGDYNYEAKLGSGELPGGTVAGTYFFWVLDGNRERDSEVFRMDLAPDQGEVWIEFDQG